MLERRKHDRSRKFALGTIAGHRPRDPLACVVSDVSEGGAFLLLDEPRQAPVELQLAWSGDTWPARIVWRSERGVGVAFAPARAATASEQRSTVVVCLDTVRRQRALGSDEQRLAERISRFVRPSRRPDPA